MKSLLFVLLTFSTSAFAQNYDASLIPDSLKKHADAVIRSEETRVVIKSLSKAVVTRKYAITILNEEGLKFAGYQNSYDKQCSLESISGHLYDASGKEIKSVKKKDIGDFSANDEVSLMTDTRMKVHNFYYTQYPYTVSYEDEQDYEGIFFLPSWRPVREDCSVQQSSFIVEAPADYGLRYKQIAFAGNPTIENAVNKKNYSWELKNYRAVKEEYYQPHWDEISPAVYIAPSQFQLDDYKGDMTSWLKLGQFINELNKDRQQLPENVKQDVHRLTDNIRDTREKINVLYNYLQSNTRYISIQLGIGSFQPFNAAYVAAKKYGDCKALSNYMVSLLKEAAIPARYVLVTAGDGEQGLREDFPSPYFNHAIMCVPQQKDTLWLECTSQTVSPGYMGSFTGHRKVLLMDEAGGHVVSTPAYNANDNLQIRKVNAVINESGDLSADMLTHFTGIQQEDVHDLMYGATEEQKKKYLNNTISLPTYAVQKFEYSDKKGLVPSVDEHLIINAPNYATITGKRLFIMPNFFTRSGTKLPEGEERKYDIRFYSSWKDADTIQIKIPANYTVEAMPKEVSLTSPYGKYSISFSVKGDIIDVVRTNERNEGTFPKEEYAKLLAYQKEIYKADRSKIVMVKKEN
jgi:transglutaminase-like putative cysteine protease